MIDFAKIKTARKDMAKIGTIADYALRLGLKRDKLSLVMDLQTAHHACPLNLDGLLAASDSDFIHDVNGIIANLNRETGELENCFLPRCAKG